MRSDMFAERRVVYGVVQNEVDTLRYRELVDGRTKTSLVGQGEVVAEQRDVHIGRQVARQHPERYRGRGAVADPAIRRARE